jgi:creatinine amidohydrolase/Fe(II)-dependent formamide hydrolase-like protein
MPRNSTTNTGNTMTLTVDPRIGEAIINTIEAENDGIPCHMILIVFPVGEENEQVRPSFVSSLEPTDVQEIIKEIADTFTIVSKINITGKHTSDTEH